MSGGGTRLPVIGGARVPGVPPGFQRIAIIGIGAVGGSLAMAARQAWPQALVIGVDTPGVIEAAMRLHAIDVGSDDLMIAGEADLVVLAGGPEENARVLPYLPDAIAGEAIVLALGGGDALAEAARSLPVRLQVVGGAAVDRDAGERHSRGERGSLSRPGLDDHACHGGSRSRGADRRSDSCHRRQSGRERRPRPDRRAASSRRQPDAV